MDKTKEFKKNLESSLEDLPSPQHFSTPKSKTASKSLSYSMIRLRTASLCTWLAEIRTSCATESMSTLQNKSIKTKSGEQNKTVISYNTKEITSNLNTKCTISEELQKVLSLLSEGNEATW
ncbi:uncharacterized protein isoform X2 [Rhodnius prolixus]